MVELERDQNGNQKKYARHSKRFKALREKHNKTQKEMAEIFRVSPKVYGN